VERLLYIVRQKDYLGLGNYREIYKSYKRGVNYNVKKSRRKIRGLEK
jgi:hypothetical protein